MFWAVGFTCDAERRLLGPFDMREQADVEADLEQLNRIQVFQANTREEAERAVKSRTGGTRGISSDEPIPPPPAFARRSEPDDFDDDER